MRKALLRFSFLVLFTFQSTFWPFFSAWANDELVQEEPSMEQEIQEEVESELDPEPEKELVEDELPAQDEQEPEAEENQGESEPDPQEEQEEPDLNGEEGVDPEPNEEEPDPEPEENESPDPQDEPDEENLEDDLPQDLEPDPLPELVISEIMIGSEINPEKDDWIGIYNAGDQEVSLEGWKINGVTKGGNDIVLNSLEVAAVQPYTEYVLAHYVDSKSSAQNVRPQSNKSSINIPEEGLIHIELKNPEGEIVDTAEFEHETLFNEFDEPVYRAYERLNPISDGTLAESWLRSTTQVNLKPELPSTFASPQAPNSHELLPGPIENMGYELIPLECPEDEEEFCFPGENFLVQFSWENPELAEEVKIQQLNDDWEWDELTVLSVEDEPFFEVEVWGQQATHFQFIAYDSWGRPSESVEQWIDTFETVLINEFFADPLKNDSKEEFIELWNVGMVPVNLSDWELTTNVESADEDDLYLFVDKSYLFSDDPEYDYILDPGEYFTLYADYSLLRLSNKSGTITLYDDWGWVMDEYNYAGYTEGYSQGRNFENLEIWEPFFHPTPNADNIDFNTAPVAQIDFQQSSYMTMNVTGENSHDADGDKLTFEWIGDEGFYSDRKNPGAFTFSIPGTKTITLTVTDAYGDTTQVSTTFKAKEKESIKAKTEQVTQEEKIYPKHQLINEVMVNPEGKDTDNEWVELYNSTSSTIDLTGWYLDDDEGKSGAEEFEEGTLIEPGAFLAIMGPGLSFKNSDDVVRLLDPNKEPVQIIHYSEAEESQTYAKNDQGIFVWTPIITPGEKNQFPAPLKSYQSGDVTFERILPNPHGSDGENEKIVIKNHLDQAIDLRGWILEDGQEHQTDLSDFLLGPNASLILVGDTIGFSLNNSDESVTLYDGLGNEIDFLSWKKAGAGQWLVDPSLFSDGMQVKVTQVVDGDTFKFDLGDGTIFTTRMIGIDTPETVHPFKPLEYYGQEASNFLKQTLTGQTVTLKFDESKIDKYGRILVYVHLDNGTFVNAEVIKQGYGYAYTRFPFEYLDDFVRYEQQAKEAGRGLWHHEEIREAVEELIEEQEELWEEEKLEEEEIIKEEEFIIIEEPVEEENIDTDETLEKQTVEEADHEVPLAEIEDWLECALGDLQIDALFPAPEKGKEEWIRLINKGETEVCLEGWQLDDIEDGGSKVFTLTEEKLAPGETQTFYKSETKINLNNKEDSVRLINPLGKEVDRIDYSKAHKNETFTHEGGDWVPKSRKKSSSSSSSKKTKRHKFDREVIAYQYDWVNEVVIGSFELGEEGKIYIFPTDGEEIMATYLPEAIDWEMVAFLDESQKWEFQLHSDDTGRELIGLAPANSFFFPSAFAADGNSQNPKKVYGWSFGLLILMLSVGRVVWRRVKRSVKKA